MEKIVMLGTGHAMVTKCFNTCFLLQNAQESVLVDCGGGNLSKNKHPHKSLLCYD